MTRSIERILAGTARTERGESASLEGFEELGFEHEMPNAISHTRVIAFRVKQHLIGGTLAENRHIWLWESVRFGEVRRPGMPYWSRSAMNRRKETEVVIRTSDDSALATFAARQRASCR
jgi:hypothetical protein